MALKVCSKKLVEIMRNGNANALGEIIAANSLLDRGWDRPPMSLEVYDGGDVQPEEREESARKLFVSRLIELGKRIRAEENPPKLN